MDTSLENRALLLPRALARRLEGWAIAALPAEACGLLVGEPCARGVLVRAVVTLTNAAPERCEDLFELDPLEHLAVEEAAAAAGVAVVGVWHSHPDSGAVPSAVDRSRAWEGWSYPIVGFAAHSGRRELRSWRVLAGVAREETHHDAPLAPIALDLHPRFLEAAPAPADLARHFLPAVPQR